MFLNSSFIIDHPLSAFLHVFIQYSLFIISHSWFQLLPSTLLKACCKFSLFPLSLFIIIRQNVNKLYFVLMYLSFSFQETLQDTPKTNNKYKFIRNRCTSAECSATEDGNVKHIMT